MTLHVLPILLRWIHLLSACFLVGAVFYYDVLLPLALRGEEGSGSEVITQRARRGIKMTIHVCLLFFLISGIYNALKNWPIYTHDPAVMHGLFGLHVLLGLGAITVLMIYFAGRTSRRVRTGWTRVALVGLVLAIAAASTLRQAREWALLHIPAAHGG